MSVSAAYALDAVPRGEDCYVTGHASGTALEINPGDYVAFSGQYVIAANDELTYYKASGLGIAMDRNPFTDQWGNKVVNSGVVVATYGIFRVSAAFSGQPNLGVVAYPTTTGSGVNAPTGLTGVASTWQTAAVMKNFPQAITYDYKDLASAISAYVAGTATGSALLPGSGLLSANMASATNSGVAQVVGWYNSGPAGTGQLDIRLWPRQADYY